MNHLSSQLWLNAIHTVAKHYRIHLSPDRIKLELDWSDLAHLDQHIELIARQAGLNVQKIKFHPSELNPWRLPVVLHFKSGQVAVLSEIHQDLSATVEFSEDEGLVQSIALDQLQQVVESIYILRPQKIAQDIRVDEYIKPFEKNWFWSLVFADWKRYIDIMLASLMANILALATVIFSMQVYDRVVPAQSIPTLWVLAGGVLIAAIFEFSLRLARIYLSDILGKRADLKISDRVFGHALRIKNSERPKSTGTFISQIRELESVRDTVTSTTISAVADLPFFFLFLIILGLIGHNIMWVMLIIVPLMLLPGLLLQKKLAQLAKEGMRESAIRNALLVEAVQGIEDIKLLRAEARFQNQWNHMNEVSANISMKQRKIIGFLTAWTQKLQGLTYAIVVLVGCFAVIAGEMTTGALVACSILASRMLGPISAFTGVLGRLQQAKTAKTSLDELMKKAVDYPEKAHLIHKPMLYGNYALQHVIFKYDVESAKNDLMLAQLNIKAGEKIAILGRNGAGKSTLLNLLCGMQTPHQGQIELDGVDLHLLDPTDIRRDVGLLNQNAQLFFGTIRENLSLGAPRSTDDEMIHALKQTSAWEFVQQKQEGLDHLILEGGKGFSGGQRQLLLLTRLLLCQPQTVLLDEPTAWLDEVSEKNLIQQLKPWVASRTLIIATHRRAVLELVDRIIVMHDGKIVKDGLRDDILMQSPSKVSSQSGVSQHGA